MILKYSLVVWGLLCFISAFSQEAFLLSKKEKKEVSRVFSDEVTVEHVPLPVGYYSGDGHLKEGDQLFRIQEHGKQAGYLLSTRAKGRYDYYDYAVIYSPENEVLSLFVTVYRSTHGAAICQKKWLGQFIGYSGGDLALGKDVDAVSGGTLSAQSMVEDMSRCYQLMIQLTSEGILE